MAAASAVDEGTVHIRGGNEQEMVESEDLIMLSPGLHDEQDDQTYSRRLAFRVTGHECDQVNRVLIPHPTRDGEHPCARRGCQSLNAEKGATCRACRARRMVVRTPCWRSR